MITDLDICLLSMKGAIIFLANALIYFSFAEMASKDSLNGSYKIGGPMRYTFDAHH